MNCSNCGTALSKTDTFRFCPYCGTSLEVSDDADDAASTSNATDTEVESPAFTADDTVRTSPPAQAKAGNPKFSETRWFMAATKPEQLTDSEAKNYDDLDQMTEPYKSPDQLSKTERNKYSLSETAQNPKLEEEK